MNAQPWLFASVGALLVLQVAIAAYVYRRKSTAGRATGGEGSVRCSECGTRNESSYRYCRNCVSELPGTVAPRRDRSSTNSRQI